MPNGYYNHGGYPATNSVAASAGLRNELSQVSAGFDKLPSLLDGIAGQIAFVNAASTAIVTNVNFTFLNNTLTVPNIAGNGAALTNLNASNLASGIVPDARFPATLPAISGANLTNLNANNIATGTLANARTTGASANTANALVLRDASGDFSAGTITASLNGNAASVTNGVYNNGGTYSINITGNAETVDGFSASQSTLGNHIVVRDGNGYIFGNYINMSDDGNPGGGAGGITSFITKQGDNFYRSVSVTNAANRIRDGANGTWPINISGNANSLNGFGSDTAASGNSIVRRDANGDIFARYLNQNSALNENPTVSQILVTNSGDNYLRKASVSHLASTFQANEFMFVRKTSNTGPVAYYGIRAYALTGAGNTVIRSMLPLWIITSPTTFQKRFFLSASFPDANYVVSVTAETTGGQLYGTVIERTLTFFTVQFSDDSTVNDVQNIHCMLTY